MIASVLQRNLAIGILFIFCQAVNAETSASSIPFKTTNTPLVEHGSRMGWGVLVFMIVLAMVLFFLRKKLTNAISTTKSSNRRLKVLESLRLSPNASLYLIQYDKQEILISQSGDKIVSLSQLSLDDSIESASNK